MKILFATGIYPPEIGGPATYCRALAKELVEEGHEVIVVTYGKEAAGRYPRAMQQNVITQSGDTSPQMASIMYVSKSGGPLLRWLRYAKALKKHGKDADIVYCFSSVSCGVPLKLARLTKPKKILRLGGDFLWERYTDRGGRLGLRKWYEQAIGSWQLAIGNWLLRHFDYIVFSTAFQEKIYEDHYKSLPSHSVIENALSSGLLLRHEKHTPFRLLFMGRFVRFKNIPLLLQCIARESSLKLTLVGDGPLRGELERMVSTLGIEDRVVFVSSVHKEEKQKIFESHDLLVLPSITEISPNTALEARAAGLPVLLSDQTGLSHTLASGMTVANLSTVEQVLSEIATIRTDYDAVAIASCGPLQERSWKDVAADHVVLFQQS